MVVEVVWNVESNIFKLAFNKYQVEDDNLEIAALLCGSQVAYCILATTFISP